MSIILSLATKPSRMHLMSSIIVLVALREVLCDTRSFREESSTKETVIINGSLLPGSDISSKNCTEIDTPLCKFYYFNNDTWHNIEQESNRSSFLKRTYHTETVIINNSFFIFCGVSQSYDNSCISHVNSSRDQKNNIKCHIYEIPEPSYTRLKNGSGILENTFVLHRDTHVYINNTVYLCSDKLVTTLEEDPWLMYAGYVCCGLSVAFLLVYLAVYTCTPKLKNLPGYILTSMNISLLLHYSSYLISQMHQVVGTSCLMFAILQHYFLLSSFFWMNVMSFDVWRTLKNATEKLLFRSGTFKLRFALYSSYAWGVPLVFKIAAVVVHYHPNTPEHLVPVFCDEFCMYDNDTSKLITFFLPAVCVLVANTFLYICNVSLIVRNKMKGGRRGNAAKANLMLHLRFGIFMGVTWVLALIVAFVDSVALSSIYIILNSSQGIFIFILFCCTEKVRSHGSMRLRSMSLSSSQKTGVSSTD